MEQRIRISVRNLVEFILRSGDIDNRRGAFAEKEAMQEGSRIHRRIQGRMGSGYQAEVPLSADVPGDGFILTVEGRADGIFRMDETMRLERGVIWSCEHGLEDGPAAAAGRGRAEDAVPMPGQISLADFMRANTAQVRAGGQAGGTEQTAWPGAGEEADPDSQARADEQDADGGRQGGQAERVNQTARTGAADETDPDSQARAKEQDADQTAQADRYIDEIKGVYRDVRLIMKPVGVHLAQAKCYAYIYGSQRGLKRIGVQMTYCNLETEEIRRFREEYSVGELGGWFREVAGRYQKWAKLQLDWRELRQSSIKGLVFPFPWREGQKEVASSVYLTMLRRKKLFIQAPTGTGKTLSTVFPAVKAVGEGLAERIFYATAKTVTRTVAEEAYALLRRQGLRMKTVTLTAKEKICFMDETECNPDACPYAKGHFDRVNDAVFEFISSGEVFDRPAIEEQAQKWQVCPFEFGLDVSVWADAVICDYNYIFDPRAKLKRFFGEGVKGDYLFLIDEAHNLVDRGREMFSAALIKEDFLALRREIAPYSRKLSRALSRCNTWMLERKRESESGPVQVLSDIGTFPASLMNLCGIMEDFMDEPGHAAVNEKVLDLYFQVRRFLDTGDRLNDNYVIYTELLEDGRFLVRLFCVDISANLQQCLDKGKSTIYFSATMLPIQYYRSLLSTAEDDYAIYAHSTFAREKRCVLIGTDTSSRYANRSEQEFRKMAEYVLQLVQAQPGNYMIFFSSYRMMEDVSQQFLLLCDECGAEVELLCQESGMNEAQREDFLRRFEQPHENGLVGFCVMGGIFGEGIDLRNDRLIGAVIVGTGLPQVCTERELLKQFYDRRGEDGFFYAYLCPGMNRVLQSAGRVIRTEEDEGVILLLDERFTQAGYRRMFPEEWGEPEWCSLGTVCRKAGTFWEGRRLARRDAADRGSGPAGRKETRV